MDLVLLLEQAALLQPHARLQRRLQLHVALVVGQRLRQPAEGLRAGRACAVQQRLVAQVAVALDQRLCAPVALQRLGMPPLAGERLAFQQQQQGIGLIVAIGVEAGRGRAQAGLRARGVALRQLRLGQAQAGGIGGIAVL